MAKTNEFERRFISLTEFRVDPATSDAPAKASGYAIVYNSASEDLGGFRELIAPGAATRSLASAGDIRALYQHDPSMLLGRRSSGTLKLTEDSHGVKFENVLPDTDYARNMLALHVRGDIRGMSFGFRVPKGGDKWSKQDGRAVRTVTDMDVGEISYVFDPAYTATNFSLRSLLVGEEAIEAAKNFVENPELVKRRRELRRLLCV